MMPTCQSLTLIRRKHNRSGRVTKYGILPSATVLRAADWTNCQQIAVKAGFDVPPSDGRVKGNLMAYRIVAERENETVRMDRMSSLMALAKARVWASEGWDVTIIVRDDDELAPAQTDRLLLV